MPPQHEGPIDFSKRGTAPKPVFSRFDIDLSQVPNPPWADRLVSAGITSSQQTAAFILACIAVGIVGFSTFLWFSTAPKQPHPTQQEINDAMKRGGATVMKTEI